ncbi:DNA polymerase III, delta prime subunit [Novosphingobium nitrogenifigens DSM 19370]|uniref:DNA polymerase III, delta prime subunit n=1 Tax=Novosphingobium nitrogenifigens DSM 19370 TaxID=983920 RepID=F1Z9X8_9SPHN|nr:DNA polymerase III subunit delta' [Novosphingobium nitrogenifigens]EGD58614.1 DNA polymerase III, delta prime subunit [Novosphingobium nitrogenifigens DSM 19370]
MSGLPVDLPEDLIGHEAVWREWRTARAGHRMHHAWLLAGREGVGKAGFARAAAVDLVAEPGIPQPPPEHHPDIHWLRPLPANDDEAKKRDDGRPYLTKRNISVDQVREMQKRLVTRPTLGSRRAVIIDAADLLEKASVNALLKSLEEPPQGTFFLLVVHQPGRLLPTVRSRCQVLRFRPLEPDEMGHALDRLAPELDALTREAAIAVAAGAPGAALSFAAQELGPAWQIMRKIVAHGDHDLSLRAQLSAAIGQRPDRERQVAALNTARMVVANALHDADDATRLRLVDAHGRLVALAREAPTYNYDPGLLMLEIGALLAGVGRTREGIN